MVPANLLAIEASDSPGAVLRPAPYELRAGKGSIEGAFLGFGLGLHFDVLPGPELSEPRSP